MNDLNIEKEVRECLKDLDYIDSYFLQRTFKIGYSRANDILNDLEKDGLVRKDITRNGMIIIKQKENEYIYSATKIKEELGFNQGTFYNRLDESNIRDKNSKDYNIEYAKKDEQTGKIMFNQKAFDLLSKYKINNSKDSVNYTVNDVDSVVKSSVISLQAHNEVVELLKKQLDDRNREISNYLEIINKKDLQIDNFQEQTRNFQILLKEKEEQILQLETKEENEDNIKKKWWKFWKR